MCSRDATRTPSKRSCQSDPLSRHVRRTNLRLLTKFPTECATPGRKIYVATSWPPNITAHACPAGKQMFHTSVIALYNISRYHMCTIEGRGGGDMGMATVFHTRCRWCPTLHWPGACCEAKRSLLRKGRTYNVLYVCGGGALRMGEDRETVHHGRYSHHLVMANFLTHNVVKRTLGAQKTALYFARTPRYHTHAQSCMLRK